MLFISRMCRNARLGATAVLSLLAGIATTDLAGAVSIDPAAFGATRNFASQAFPNSPIQMLTTFSFEDRAHIEFDISSLSAPIVSAELDLPVTFSNAGAEGDQINIGSYTGDGAITFSDFSAATNFDSFITSAALVGTVLTFDVTAIINALVLANENYAGFTGSFDQVWPANPINLGNPTVQFGGQTVGPQPVLRVEAGVAPVPLPAAFPLFAGGLAVLGLFGWRRKRTSDVSRC